MIAIGKIANTIYPGEMLGSLGTHEQHDNKCNGLW